MDLIQIYLYGERFVYFNRLFVSTDRLSEPLNFTKSETDRFENEDRIQRDKGEQITLGNFVYCVWIFLFFM